MAEGVTPSRRSLMSELFWLLFVRPLSFHDVQELVDAEIGGGRLCLGISQPCIKVNRFVDFSLELGSQSCYLGFEQSGSIFFLLEIAFDFLFPALCFFRTLCRQATLSL